MSRDFLLEVGCEDIPARLLATAQDKLKALLEDGLAPKKLIKAGAIQTWGTPRRLAAYCEEMQPAEPDRTEQEVGPPYSVAYDAAGKPTRAADSFARKHGVSVSKLASVETAKGRYVAIVRHHRGRPAQEVLAEVLPDIIARITFPRSMYWTSVRGVRFIRPIRWLVALYAGKIINFEFGGVKSGRVSRGHRVLANRRIPIQRASTYRTQLQRAFVLVNPEDRRHKITKEITRLLKGDKLRAKEDKDLLDLVIGQAEWPTPLKGEFRKDFLNLPSDVLVTVMRHHQKYFSVEDHNGKLAPRFVTVLDLDRDSTGEIRRGHESVLEARFRDAQFFWKADQRQSLTERVALLKDVTFQAKLGSYAQKIERVGQLSRLLAESLRGRHADIDGRHADIATVERAAFLSKSDLTTQLVGELPELQGIVGGVYARTQGESKAVAAAIAEHYRPAGPDDPVPETLVGALLALADKLDTLAGCFSIGAVPTGSKDPYALRRAAAGIVRILVEKKINLDLREAVGEAVGIIHQQRPVAAKEDTPSAVLGFLEDRARFYFRESGGFAYDEINAAFSAGWTNLHELSQRLEALHRARPTPDFEPLASSFKRIKNILEKAGGATRFVSRKLDGDRIEAGAEQALYDAFQALRPTVAGLREKQQFSEALGRIATLRPVVDQYFDQVLVNTPDPALRENRLTLLAQLLQEFSLIAEFSEIVTAPKTTRSPTDG